MLWVIWIGDEVQDREQQHGNRFGEVECPGGPGEDGRGVAQVGVDVVTRALAGAGEQGTGMHQHQGSLSQ